MPLQPGTRLGPYKITAPIGAGGMGEVYRAKDTKLGRDVAIKVLPDAVAGDSERLARFHREAQVLASLNHPNIAAIYGVEDSSSTHALVMELVEGPTLADRIAQGLIPLDEALPIARQIAEALEAAHEQGIIHRDLKPANIKVRPDATVKVLDFGLAKLVDPAATGPQAANVTASPTITSPAMMTGVGLILGTAAYMSPEQAKGHAADHRSDIFSFGAVLYEMLSGRQPFQGETVPDVLASVLAREADLAALPSGLNPRLLELLKRCLEKNPKRRWQAVGDLRADIEACAAAPYVGLATTATTGAREPLWKRVLLVGVPALVLGGALAAEAVYVSTRPMPPRVSRLTLATSSSATPYFNNDSPLAITPDGSRIVYIGNGGTQIFVRPLDNLESVAISTSVNASNRPFVSPDGQWVGFFEGTDSLKKVAITGGPAILVARLSGIGLRGGTWTPDDTIIIGGSGTGGSGPTAGLRRVSAAGGNLEVLTTPDSTRGEAAHFWPEVLPGGRAVLFTIAAAQRGGLDAGQIAVLDLRTKAQKIVLRGGSHAHYVSSGHLVYTAGGTLRAVPFDLNRLETRGTAVPVTSRLLTTTTSPGDVDVSSDGTLVYVDAAGIGIGARTLVWVDRTGKEEPIAVPPRTYVYPRISPDGGQVALDVRDQGNDIWTLDLRRSTLANLTAGPSNDIFPVWTPDGRRIIFTSDRGGGVYNLWQQAADGSGVPERLTTSQDTQASTGITPDGKEVVFADVTPTMARDLMQVALDGSHRVTPLLQTPFEERNGVVSPDGHWLAYESLSSGRYEIYVRPYPNTGTGQWQVSTTGGTRPVWARSGKELFFFAADGVLMRVPVESAGVRWAAGSPAKLFEARYYSGAAGFLGATYDISPDGQHFLMIKPLGNDQAAGPPGIIVVQHFDEELKRLVPTK